MILNKIDKCSWDFNFSCFGINSVVTINSINIKMRVNVVSLLWCAPASEEMTTLSLVSENFIGATTIVLNTFHFFATNASASLFQNQRQLIFNVLKAVVASSNLTQNGAM